MRETHTLLLHSGGLRSLVAAGTLGGDGVAWLYVHDGRPSDEHHRAAFVRQAEHFEPAFRTELSLDHLRPASNGSQDAPPLAQLQLLTVAAAQAVRLGATRVVWPVSCGEDYEVVSRITETLVMLEHTVQLETGCAVKVDTPLVDLTLHEVVQAGEQMGAAWQMSRTCRAPGQAPCGECGPCRRRAAAFAAANLSDPLFETRPTPSN